LIEESYIAKYCCDSSGASVAEEILGSVKDLVVVLLMSMNHKLLWMMWTGVGPGTPWKALIYKPQGVSWMLGLT